MNMDPTRPERCAKRRPAGRKNPPAALVTWSPGAPTRVSLHRLCHANQPARARRPGWTDYEHRSWGICLQRPSERLLLQAVPRNTLSTLTARALPAPYVPLFQPPSDPVELPRAPVRRWRGLVCAPKLPRIPTAPPRPITSTPAESLPVRRELHSLAWRLHTGPFSVAAGQPQHRLLQNRTQARLARSNGAVQRCVHHSKLHECLRPSLPSCPGPRNRPFRREAIALQTCPLALAPLSSLRI